MSNQQDLHLVPGEIVPSTFRPGIVAASYVASLNGCFLTIELLNRRKTGLRNLTSWIYTFACAISLGFCGIWCMHFIGNRAITLGQGEFSLQLVYSPGFTVFSAFLPFLGLIVAFSVAELPAHTRFWHWMAWVDTGVFAGLAIVGMHYIGNLAINNYDLTYRPRFLAASVIIAVGDSLLTLLLFYTWREKWINNLWKRLLCAALLAAGVSAMHFTAATQCIYRFKHYDRSVKLSTRDTAAIAAGVLSGVALLANFALMIDMCRKMRKRQRQSLQISVACVFFAEDSRILLNADGSLPNRRIAEKYNHRRFEEDFDTSHPIFQWLFRVSRNWPSIVGLIPQMRLHYAADEDGSVTNLNSGRNGVAGAFPPESYDDFTILFREGFCLAVASMADELHIAINRLGILYDNIIDIGLNEQTIRSRIPASRHASVVDIEALASNRIWGSGQLMILARRLDTREVEQFTNAGIRFSIQKEATRPLADQLQMPLSVFQIHMGKLDRYIKKQYSSVQSGVYLALFALKPTLGEQFDVLVKKEAEDQLPDVQLVASNHTNDISDFLQQFDEETPEQMILSIQVLVEHRHMSPKERFLADRLIVGIDDLRPQAPAHWFKRAKFCAKPQKVYYSQALRPKPNPSWLYAFVVVGDLNTSLADNAFVTNVPRKFLSVRHMCYPGSPNHFVLAREIHLEFGPILAQEGGVINRPLRPLRAFLRRKRRASIQLTPRQLSTAFTLRGSINSPKDESIEMFPFYQPPRRNTMNSDGFLPTPATPIEMGGIMVNNATVVEGGADTGSLDNIDDGPRKEHPKGRTTAALKGTTTTDVGVAEYEPTFVDKLSEVTWKWLPRFRW